MKPINRSKIKGNADESQPRPVPIDVPEMPYAGLLIEDEDPLSEEINAGRKAGEFALTGPHMLLSGLTGRGKGRRVICQNIVMWAHQPVIAMSTKGDLVDVTIKKRAQRGPVYLMDLSEEVMESDLKGVEVTRVVSDPCKLVNTDDESMAMSDLLQATAKVGSASGGDSGNSDPTWENLAARPLAAFIRAGGALPHPDTGEMVDGGGVNWVVEALEHPPRLDRDGQAVDDPTESDFVTPNWSNAYLRASALLESRHAESLRAVMNMVDKQRDSVAINMRNALKAWSLDAVAGDRDAEAFHPSMLEQPGATLYVTSPIDGSTASAACAVIEQSIQWWRRNVGRKLPTLGLFLDELAQCAPLPKLPAHISVLRGYNVRLIAAVQNTTQLKRRYKDSYEEMLTTFPSVLIMPGTPEKDLLEQASWFAGEDERVTSSTDEYDRTTRSTERVERVTASELIPRKKGEGRLLIGGQPGMFVRLPDISETDLLN
ncbi:type IV secretory system conjugative DNA transfer family protein [Spelaeicoccus albus]|uniref:Type IV secretion system protein VirD4 n=1 Tax=Spelaeicoccus albus TaxID=1280376 RepID=A0A7Z0D1H2_9MICO|nr:type IV secretory system conjugative DNA transfer family protein [Spelaeicoccus albus]NYI66085.1 type IV secretion system protein VirD4 [Spelaeicoccus albus]